MSDVSYDLWINGQLFRVALAGLDGLQIRALAALPPEADVVLEGVGEDPDTVIGDAETVDLKARTIRIYSRPPTTFGRGR